MTTQSIFSAFHSHKIASLIMTAKHRVIFAAPGIQTEPAAALIKCFTEHPDLSLTVSLDVDERTLRMGYGTLEGVEMLRQAGIAPIHSPGFRTGILIVDERGWIFTPTALYLEQESRSDETPNAIELSTAQVEAIAIRLSPDIRQEAIDHAATPEEAIEIAELPIEIGVMPLGQKEFEEVKLAIAVAPPVKFDIARQVRVFEPFLQYVELSLTGAAMQRHRVSIPKSLQKLGTSKDIEGRLRTTFDLIKKDGELSSKPLETDLNEIRKNFTRSLGKNHGRVILKSAKPRLIARIKELQAKLESHQKNVKGKLQDQIDKSKDEVTEYYLPMVKDNPPDALWGSLINSDDDTEVRSWIYDELSSVFPSAESLISKMTLEERYKDVTFETLNRDGFLKTVKNAFPHMDWDKPYKEFKAVGEQQEPIPNPQPEPGLTRA
jgi:hypothetical protein